MKQNRRGATASQATAALSVLLVGVALYMVSGSERQGIQVKEYAEAIEAADNTAMIYIDKSGLGGDYGATIADPWEMMDTFKMVEQEGKSPSLRVVVEAGGFTRWELDEMDGVPYARFSLTGDGISSMESMEIGNMGDASTLTDFIDYGVRSYPANHYGLTPWDHEGGPAEGCGGDSHFDGDGPSLKEIGEASGHSVMAGSIFDFVAFDACPMGNVETADCPDGYADYVITSPELEPQHRYDYRWMVALEDSPPPSMEREGTASRSMMEAYSVCYVLDTASVATSLLDMKEYPAFYGVFHQHMDGMPEKLREKLYGELERDGMKMLTSGSRQVSDPPELVDVLEFLNACQRVCLDENAFQTLKDWMGGLVTKQWAKGYPMDPSGLTIYLPSGSNPCLSGALGTYGTTGSCSACRRLTDGYAAYLARESGVEWGDISAYKGGTVKTSIAPEDASGVTEAHLAMFYPAGGDENYYLLHTDSDMDIGMDGTLRAAPEDSCTGIKRRIFRLIETMNLDAYTEYMVPVLYNGESCTMRIGFDEGHEGGQILSMTPADQTSEAAKQTYELKEGDQVTPLYLVERMKDVGGTLGSTGNALGQIMEDRYYTDSYYMGAKSYIEEPGDMLLEAVPASGDGYLYGLMLMDIWQNIYYTDFIGMGAEDSDS